MANSYALTYEVGPPYQLANGYKLRCMTAGGRHDSSPLDGSKVQENIGIDVRFAWLE